MPLPASTPIDALKTRVLTGVVNRRTRSHQFLTRLLFPVTNWETLANDEVQVDQLAGSPIMAPFIEVNGEAVMLTPDTWNSYTVQTPYISLKDPVSANRDLLNRMAGEASILQSPGEDVLVQHLNKRILEGAQKQQTSVFERIEWMVANALRGSISYSVENRANWALTFAKPAGNTITLSTFWDEESSTPLQDILAVKRVQSNNEGPALTDAICGSEAAAAIAALVEADTIKLWAPEQRNVSTGNFTGFVNQFEDTGVLFLGTIGGIRFWEYSQQTLEEDGSTTFDLVRPKYIEFVSTNPRALAMNPMYFGAILDVEAIRAGLHINRFYATTELKKDPSVHVQYLKSRPLPVLKRPDWNVSVKVVSG